MQHVRTVYLTHVQLNHLDLKNVLLTTVMIGNSYLLTVRVKTVLTILEHLQIKRHALLIHVMTVKNFF